MSFSFYVTGSKRAVLAECAKRYERESQHAIVVKEAVTKLLDGAPDDTVVSVESGGHHDYGGHYVSGTVDLRFRLTKALPEPPVDEPPPA